MRISLNWIKEYIDLDGISNSEIIEQLTMSGLEVEDAIDQSSLYKNFVVGEVLKKESHPNADKLSICTVFDGKNELQVICGASNVDAGQKIVFASIGSLIPNGNFEIKKAKIRGEESFGMICAEDELLLSDDHSGIMVLDENLTPGTPIISALNLNDLILEIGVTPNRPDALSHIGVTRDLAALFDKELKHPVITTFEGGEDVNKSASIIIEDTVNCPRYVGVVVKGITVSESPEWLKKKLKQMGSRSINNIVDITNFILHEYGQPLHAFDLDRLAGKKIILRSTKEEMKFTTLDSKERILPIDTLMICDGEREVAIAGVMGGENSEISSTTKNILIESAYFNPSSVRRTSKKLGLSTDASYRFERGTDPYNVPFAAERAANLVAKVAGGKICKGIIDVYPTHIKRKVINLRFARVKKILGYDVDHKKIKNVLLRLGFELSHEDNLELKILVPGFRPDVEREIDLIEEIARIHGYDNIPTISKISITLGEKKDDSEFVDNVRNHAVALGFFEMINNPLQPINHAEIFGNPIELSNPLSLDMAYLRTSLIRGALTVVARNINYGEKNIAVFEAGNIFAKKSDSNINSFDDFTEKESLVFLISGNEVEKSWNTEQKQYDFTSLKGKLNSFIKKISLDNVITDLYYSEANNIYEFYFTKNHNNDVIGSGGKVRKDILSKFNIDQDVFCFEFDLTVLKKIEKAQKVYSEPLKYPKVIRDCAFVFDSNITFIEVKNFIQKNSTSLLKNVEIFDVFESESLGENKKSMAFTLEFYDDKRTLTEEEVENVFSNIITSVKKEFNAILRGDK